MFNRTKLFDANSSGVAPSGKRGSAVFSRLENTSLRIEISLTSLCLVTTQYPPSWKPESTGCSFHQIGAVRRNSASSSTGNRSRFRSGSVKSKPGGRVGLGIGGAPHGVVTPTGDVVSTGSKGDRGIRNGLKRIGT